VAQAAVVLVVVRSGVRVVGMGHDLLAPQTEGRLALARLIWVCQLRRNRAYLLAGVARNGLNFNSATVFDEAVFATMGMLIAVVVADIVIITLWSLKSLDAPASFSLAIKVGLLLMVVGQGLGGVLIREGMRQEEVGPVTSPLVFGQDGILNLSHAAALHALQLLPVLAWLLSFSGRSESRRTKIVGVAACGYAGLVLLTGLQALGGRAPFDLSGVGAVVLIVSTTAILAASGVALVGVRPRLSPSR